MKTQTAARPETGLGQRIAFAALLLIAVGFFLVAARRLFFLYPLPWPDEALFANPAINLLRRGVMATDLFSGLLPGASRCTFLQPPLYYLYLWGVFSVAGASLRSVRGATLALGLIAAWLTYSLSVRSGLNRWTALCPVALLLLDTTFLRGSLVGRMDAPALVFILLALILDLGPPRPRKEEKKGRAFSTGIVCGLAALAHPMGAAAGSAIVLRNLAFPEAPRKRVLPALLAGMLAPFLFWLAYIVRHGRDFVAQFGGQILTKAGRRPWAPQHVLHTLRLFAAQYGAPESASMIAVWCAGVAGLSIAARRRPGLWVLAICQVTMMAVAMWGGEMWYVLYLAPLTAVGLVHLMVLAADREPRVRAVGWLALALSMWFGQQNVIRTYKVEYAFRSRGGQWSDPTAWCRQIERTLPRNSNVLLAVIPDPYFCLEGRRDLTIHEFLPKGFPVPPGKYRRWLLESDDVIVRGADPSSTAWRLAQEQGRLVATVGAPVAGGFYAKIYKMRK